MQDSAVKMPKTRSRAEQHDRLDSDWAHSSMQHSRFKPTSRYYGNTSNQSRESSQTNLQTRSILDLRTHTGNVVFKTPSQPDLAPETQHSLN